MLKIVGIGDNVVDRYLYKKKMYPGGNAVNVPVLAHKTGRAEAAYIGTVGTDYAGSHIVDSLKREGLDVSHVKIKEGETAYADVTLVDSDRVFIGGIDGVSHDIEITEELKKYMAGFNLIHTSCYSGLDEKLPELHKIGVPIAYDYSDKPHWNNLKRTLPYVTYAIFSGGSAKEEELKVLMEGVGTHGPKQVLMTMGSRGSMLYDVESRKFYQQGIYPVENIVDTMGAGDSFIARYFVGIYAGEAIGESMENAAEFAAKNCLVSGTFGDETDIK